MLGNYLISLTFGFLVSAMRDVLSLWGIIWVLYFSQVQWTFVFIPRPSQCLFHDHTSGSQVLTTGCHRMQMVFTCARFMADLAKAQALYREYRTLSV